MSSYGSGCTIENPSALQHPRDYYALHSSKLLKYLPVCMYVRGWADWLCRLEESWERRSEEEVAACFQRAQTLNPQSHSSHSTAHGAAVREAVKEIILQQPPPPQREGVALWVRPTSSVEQQRLKAIGSSPDYLFCSSSPATDGVEKWKDW